MPRHMESKQRLVRYEYLLPEMIFVSFEGLASSQWYLSSFQQQTVAYFRDFRGPFLCLFQFCILFHTGSSVSYFHIYYYK